MLGVRRELIVPAGVEGRVSERIGGGQVRVPVQYGEALLSISTASIASPSEADSPRPLIRMAPLHSPRR